MMRIASLSVRPHSFSASSEIVYGRSEQSLWIAAASWLSLNHSYKARATVGLSIAARGTARPHFETRSLKVAISSRLTSQSLNAASDGSAAIYWSILTGDPLHVERRFEIAPN